MIDAAPDPRRLPPPDILEFRDAVVVPPVTRKGLPCGVFDADARFVELSRSVLQNHKVTDVPGVPEDVQTLRGRYVFGGLVRSHFGHFLLEALTRHWVFSQDIGPVDGVLFLPVPGRNVVRQFRGGFGVIHNALSGGANWNVVSKPTAVSNLVLPSPGFGHLERAVGTAEFRAHVRQSFRDGDAIEPGADKLYISRSQLTQTSGIFDREDDIEALMAGAGYKIFHPEAHSVEDQVRAYRAARVVVGGDGSAFHFAAFVLRDGVRVGLVRRRHRPHVIASLVHQLQRFAGAEVVDIDALLPEKTSPDEPDLLDHDSLVAQLRDGGFL